ncbi:MAG: DUF2065 domain-containing protein [Paracoccaceae bacterium]|nr:DUF2065 domain-containing protein [Paracoccaceae bacterium]
MSLLLLGIGLVLVIEGLVFALAPSRLEDLLDALRQMPVESRRMVGLVAIAGGVFLIWLAGPVG